MKTKIVILSMVIILISSITTLHAMTTTTTSSSCDFVVFSDTHIGMAIGADNMTATTRYHTLLQSTNNINASFMVNIGDLVDGPTTPNPPPYNFAASYDLYGSISQESSKPILNVKGNHDSNNTIYSYMIGSMNWAERYGDILVVGIGSVAEGGNWEQNVSYNQATTDFLNWTVNSQLYTETSYHFLLEHYPPATKWPGVYGGNCSVPSTIWPYYSCFNIIFCGHEGGIEYATTFQGTPVVKDAHLGDGFVRTDTFLTVTINPNINIIVVSNNFVTGQTYTLDTVPITATIALQEYDMTSAGEFRIIVNGKTVFSSPTNVTDAKIWINFQLDISQYIRAGANTIVFANPTTAYNKMRNLTITVNGIIVISDNATYALQNTNATGAIESVTFIFKFKT
jgi:hypothetical protein